MTNKLTQWKKKINVFYAWQSDLPENKTIKDVLYFNHEENIELNIVTSDDVIGTNDIAQSIFDMIKGADIFIADLTIIGKIADRKVSNPNVLVEWGYARGVLGLGKMISIFNEKCGSKVEDLSFDIKTKRTITFNSDKKTWRKELKKKLLGEIKEII
jgi:hypothetical protein